MNKRPLVPVVLLLALGMMCSTAWAQGGANAQPIFTYVDEWGVPRDQWGAIEKSNAEIKPLLDSLVADGTLIGYGFFQNRVHSDGGYTHGGWFQARSVGNILKALERIYAQPANVTNSAQAASKHQDYLMVANIHGAKAVTNSTGYLRVISVEIQWGHMDGFTEIYNRYLKPVYDKLVADGAIVSYQLDTEWSMQNAPSRLFSAVVMPDAEAINKVNMAFNDMFSKNPAVLEGILSHIVPNTRQDLLARITQMTRK